MSLHIVLNGKHRAILAADSRAAFPSGETHDDYVKLFVAGTRTLCGFEGIMGGKHDRHAIVRVVAAVCARNDLQDRPRELLEAMRDELRADLARVVSEEPSLFSALVLQKAHSGAATLFRLEFLAGSEPTITPVAEATSRAFFYSQGYDDGLTLELKRFADRDLQTDESAIRRVDQIFEAARASAEVGGRVDIITIDCLDGCRWLRKKPAGSIFRRLYRSIAPLHQAASAHTPRSMTQ
jgi:hypothetical protein